MHTEDTVSAADHSSYRIDMQIKPFEYICSWSGDLPVKMTFILLLF